MAVAVGILGDTRRRTLEAICDTFAPSLGAAEGDAVLQSFYARSAADLGVATQIEGLLAQTMQQEEIDALGALLDAFAEQNFANQGLSERTAIVHAISES